MSRLTDDQLARIQHYLDRALSELAHLGVRLDVCSDMAEWAGFLRAAPGTVAVTTSFDPEHSYLTPSNSYWLALRNSREEIVGCICLRLFLTDDVLQLIRSWRLFFDRVPILEMHPLQLVNPSEIPIIAGRVGYAGGYWLHPDQRGRGLTRLLPRMNRALALRHFDVDWVCGLNKDTPNRVAMVQDSYGMTSQFSCIHGYFPPRGEVGYYQLAYVQRVDILKLIAEDSARPGTLARTEKSVAA